MRLGFVAQPEANGQILANADIVLDIPPELVVRIIHQRTTSHLEIRRGRTCLVGVEVREHEHPILVARFRAVITAALEQQARAHRVPSEVDVEVVSYFYLSRPAVSLQLRPASIESVQYLHGRRVDEGNRFGSLRGELETKLIEQALAERARLGRANDRGIPLPVVGAFGQVKIADTEVAILGRSPLQLGPECV